MGLSEWRGRQKEYQQQPAAPKRKKKKSKPTVSVYRAKREGLALANIKGEMFQKLKELVNNIEDEELGLVIFVNKVTADDPEQNEDKVLWLCFDAYKPYDGGAW